MPPTRDKLARRYRRLLVCYPRQYRRARGDEIVATFLELAPPDRTRPTAREAVNLVLHGLRCRLGRPRSRTVVLWAALTALVGGLSAGAFATRLAWETARPLPTQAEATELFSGLLGQDVAGKTSVDPALFVIYTQPLTWENADILLSFDAGEYQPGRATVGLGGPSDVNHRDLVDSTRAWLGANGWSVSDVAFRNRVECANSSCDEASLPQSAVFVASRGDDVLSLEISLGDQRPRPPKPGVMGYDETYAYVELTRAAPVAVYPVGVAGFALGAAPAWLLFGWASRRTEDSAALRQSAAKALFFLALFVWCLPIALVLPNALKHHLDGPHPSWHPMWEWLGQPALLPLFAFGTGAALLALGAAALPRRHPVTDAKPSTMA
jgi:hypothetical protein